MVVGYSMVRPFVWMQCEPRLPAWLQQARQFWTLAARAVALGADAVSSQEEQRRVLPVLEALSDLDVVLSVDTYHAETCAGCHSTWRGA
jgi:hypothetical protein